MTAAGADGYRLDELARRFGLTLRGEGARRIDGVGTLAGAGPSQLAFLANPRYAAQLAGTRAGAVVLDAASAENCPAAALVAADAYLAFARIAALFERLPAPAPGVSASAVVEPGAVIEAGASIGAQCFVAAGSRVCAGAVIGPQCVIGPDCTVGPQSYLVARVTLALRVHLGARVRIHPGAVLGSDGFGLAWAGMQWEKVPQLGGVRIGDDCEIGANTTIDRGALEDTVLEEDVRLDNQIQIAHNVHIGAHTAMAGCAAVAGSAHIGRHCLIGGGAGVLGHLQVCDRVTITAMSLVTHSIREPGEYSSGAPLQENRLWRRNTVRIRQLDDIARRLAALEKGPRP